MPDEAKRQDLPLEDKKEQVVMTTTANGEAQDQDMHAFWHSSSHLLAHAVKRLFPETKLAIGPAIENGFYYDFDREGGFTTDDLPAIEEEMKKIVKANYKIERFTLPREEAIEYVKQQDEPYKLEMILALPDYFRFHSRSGSLWVPILVRRRPRGFSRSVRSAPAALISICSNRPFLLR
jgi:threonyl-tRNA synthetase